MTDGSGLVRVSGLGAYVSFSIFFRMPILLLFDIYYERGGHCML